MKRTKKSATENTESTEVKNTQTTSHGQTSLLGKLVILSVADVLPNPKNPRGTEKPDAEFLEFAANIKSQGVREPILVRTHPSEAGKYEVLNGHRRIVACLHNSMLEIPAITYGVISDKDAFEIFFACQIQKKLKLFEEAKLVAMLMDEYKADVTVVASRIGKGIRWVRQMCAINGNLAPCWRNPFEKGELEGFTAAHLQLIAGYPASIQKEIFESIQTGYGFNMSVEEFKIHLANQEQRLDKAIFDVQDPTLAKTGACVVCLMRTDVQPGLFDDTADEKVVKKNARCLNPDCWEQKEAAALANKVTSFKQEHKELVAVAKEYLSGEEWKAAEKYKLAIIGCGEFEASKKDAKGAVPAIVIKGSGLGELIWIKPATGRKQVIGEDGQIRTKPTGTPKTLKERKELLESKRWFVTIKPLIGKISECGVEKLVTRDPVATVMALAATFGVKGQQENYADAKKSKRSWKYFAGQPDVDEVLAGLWEQCRDTICRDLTYNGPITQVPEQLIDDAKNAAKLLGIDLDALYKEVGEKQYPEPKGWKGLKSDGTPKEIKKQKSKSKKADKNSATEVTENTENSKRQKPIAKVRKCRICGCTEENPCVDENGDACHYVEKDLCSNPDCAKKAAAKAKKNARKEGKHYKKSQATADVADTPDAEDVGDATGTENDDYLG